MHPLAAWPIFSPSCPTNRSILGPQPSQINLAPLSTWCFCSEQGCSLPRLNWGERRKAQPGGCGRGGRWARAENEEGKGQEANPVVVVCEVAGKGIRGGDKFGRYLPPGCDRLHLQHRTLLVGRCGTKLIAPEPSLYFFCFLSPPPFPFSLPSRRLAFYPPHLLPLRRRATASESQRGEEVC